MSTNVNIAAAGGAIPPYLESRSSTAAIISNGLALFNVTGDCLIQQIISECYTANDVTASTLQYAHTPTGGSLTTISGASASLASAAIGATVTLNPTALATAPTVSANGVSAVGLGQGVRVQTGVLSAVVGVGSTTGTWRHYVQYIPLEQGAMITPTF